MNRDGVHLEDLCPKFRIRRWRRRVHESTGHKCIYCGAKSQSIDHIVPQSKGGRTTIENCAPACLRCNGKKSDEDVFAWYRRQGFYDSRRLLALKAWMDGDIAMAQKYLDWVEPKYCVIPPEVLAAA